MYGAWGATFGEVIAHVLRNPRRAADPVHDARRPRRIRSSGPASPAALLPLAFLPLLRPLTLLLALPVLAAHLLSGRIQQHTIVFQYTALVTPAYIVAAIEAAGGSRTARPRGAATQPAWRPEPASSPRPASARSHRGTSSRPRGRSSGCGPPKASASPPSRAIRVVARLHGRDGIVRAGFELLSHFANRANVHSVHHVLSGRYVLDSRNIRSRTTLSGVVADYGNARLLPYLDERSGARLRSLIDENGLQPVDAWGTSCCSRATPRRRRSGSSEPPRPFARRRSRSSTIVSSCPPASGCCPLDRRPAHVRVRDVLGAGWGHRPPVPHAACPGRRHAQGRAAALHPLATPSTRRRIGRSAGPWRRRIASWSRAA